MLRLLPKIISSNPKIPTTMTAETTAIKRTEPKENNKGKDTNNNNNTNNNTKYNKANSNSSEEKMTTKNNNSFELQSHAAEATTHDGMVKKL
jgi:hypothetical protein